MKAKKTSAILFIIVIFYSTLWGCGTTSGSLPLNNSNNTILQSEYTSLSNTSSNNIDAKIIADDKETMKNIDLSPKIYSDYYISKVTIFMNTYNGHGKIVFLGDSLTDMGNWSEMLNNTDIINRGISSDTTTSVINRLSEITRLKPRKIFIMIGVNDIDKGLSTNEIITNYNKILSTIKKDSPNSKVYVESVLPINKDIFKTSTNEQQIIDLNLSLMELCENSGIGFINLYPLFTVKKDKLNPNYTEKGVHLNGSGYLVWSEAIKEYCN